MSLKINEGHKTFIRVFITYGIHIWLLIFVCNVVIFYSIRFFINASTSPTAIVAPSGQTVQNQSLPTDIPTLVPTAAGPVVELSFSLPGIGTNGGNLRPSHPDREATIYLYNSDANASDKNVMPVYTARTHVIYDGDPNSPTYTFFVNKYVDLGAVANGNYQIAIQTPQAMRSIIKSSDQDSLRGQLFEMSDRRFFVLPPQSMITGDIYPLPNGDNFMDINDYNALVGCFNIQINSTRCADAALADLDDNGIADGIDYNIMLINFRTLLSQGFSAPIISISPSGIPVIGPAISTSPPKNITPSPVQREISRSGAYSTIIIFILFVLVVGIIAFLSYKFHLLNILFPKKGELQNAVESLPADEAADQTTEQSADPAAGKTPATDTVEKSGFLKKVSVDTQTNGTWVTLADDSGTTKGFYPKGDVSDGFVKIKGIMKNDQQYKPYIFITEITTQE